MSIIINHHDAAIPEGQQKIHMFQISLHKYQTLLKYFSYCTLVKELRARGFMKRNFGFIYLMIAKGLDVTPKTNNVYQYFYIILLQCNN